MKYKKLFPSLGEPKDAHEELIRTTIHKYNQFDRTLEQRNNGRRSRGESLYTFSPYRGQGEVLVALQGQDSMTQANLARTLDIRPQTLSCTLRKLEQSGLVKREPDPKDKRVLRVSLTQKGVEVCDSLNERAKYSGSMFEALSEEELVLIGGMFDKLREHLRAEIEAAQRAEELVSPECE